MPISIVMPPIDADFEAGTLNSWHKQVGDSVAKGDIVFDVETDKAVVEVNASASGTLGRIDVADGTDEVAVDTVVGWLLAEGESVDDIGAAASTSSDQSGQAEATTSSSDHAPSPAEPPASSAAVAPPPAPERGRLFASPASRRIAKQHGIDLTQIVGRGPRGRILKSDVEAAVAAKGTAAQSAPSVSGHTDVPHSKVRRVTAERLTAAKRDIPHFYLTVDCELDGLLARRAELNEQLQELGSDQRVSVNDFVIKAVACALSDVPEANVSWADEAMRQYTSVDVSVAVDTPGGLLTPIVRDAANRSLTDISAEVRRLAARAREGKLQHAEFKGGGFTVSNLGMFGVKSFSAIINPPQACILAVGAAEKRAVVRDDELAIATRMTCTLSVDHRAVDGAVGARFLAAFKRYLERPLVLIGT